MSTHFQEIKKAVKGPLSSLITSESKTIIDVREHTQVLDHTPTRLFKIYVNTKESKELSTVGWVSNENVLFCLDCFREFSFLTRKHHCRACGNVLCSHCCNSFSVISGFEDLGKVRVCNQCDPQVSLYLVFE
jgi:hypothetical protein